MRAAVVREFCEDLSIETVPDPTCPDNGVVLEVAACGVCRSDYHGWSGAHPKVQNGSILGHEYCGTVVEAGPQAQHSVGDRLIAPFILGCGSCSACQTGVSNTCSNQIVPGFGTPGAYAEYVAVPFDHNLVHLPETLSPSLAAGLGCRVTTAWHALTDRADVAAGEWVAVHGTGGIGLSVLLLAKMLGCRVVVVDVVEEKLEHAKLNGAEASAHGTHSMRRTKMTQIYKKTGNLRAVQLLLGHTKMDSTVRYLGVELEDALAIAEDIEI